MTLPPMEISSNSLSYMKPLKASSNPDGHWSDHQWVELTAVDNGDWSGSFWEPDAKDKTPWVEIDLGKVVKISQAIIYERGNAVRSFELQNMAGDQWKTFYTGKTIGSKLEIKLPKVTTQKVRLVLKDFSKVPGIYELVLL